LALDGKKNWDTEFRIVRPDGRVAHIRANGSVIRDGQGKPARMIGINADITERKNTEEALQNAQRLESLGLLAGGIAHDFNNLLTGIFGYVELAHADSRDESVVDCLASCIETIDRARSLTRQLLTFAKGGAPILKTGPLFPFVQDTVRFALSGSNVSCHVEGAEHLRPCSFDRNQIAQVLENIVINALQAMPVGGALEVRARNVEIKSHPTLKAGVYVRISVRDQGIGIPRELLSRVFDPFFTTKPKGHGLGLATSYSIVKRHGGCIEAESELGKGSTFHVYLPAADDAAVADASAHKAGHRGQGTFLLMDDEEVVLETTGRMLESFGYTVVRRTNGKDAVDFFAQERKAGRELAGMIFDLTIPGGMGGEEAVKAIRLLDHNLPVFVVSGYAEDPVMAEPGAYGFTASLCKPFMRAELARMLEKHIGQLPR
jgi:signal transduction histidine kinase/CheY-like chemotaxis protein